MGAGYSSGTKSPDGGKWASRWFCGVTKGVTLSLALFVSACVANQNAGGPGADISVALSPTTSDQPAATETATPPTTEAQPAQKVALAPAEPASTPAETATAEQATPPAAKTEQEPKTFFAALAANNNANKEAASPARRPTVPPVAKTEQRTASTNRPRPAKSGEVEGLPGVRKKTTIFGIINNTDKLDDDLDEPVEVASLPSQTRRGNFGLLLQRPDVQVHCFPRSLVNILKRVERKFGKTPVVTSGYRSRSKNRRVRGARNSTHIQCQAADIQVPGVSKWTLAKYLRSQADRGGVGTYCHTNSVHIDIGKKRDWNWRCRRKRR